MDGHAYITGSFSGMATFGAGTNAVTLVSAGKTDMFVAKYGSTGALRWIQQASTVGWANGNGIAVDEAGNAYVTGHYEGHALFGEGAEAVTLVSAGDADVFLAKYSPGGRLRWVRGAGGPSRDAGSDVAVDSSGNAVITGAVSGTAGFGEGSDAVILTTHAGSGVFVAQYGPRGALQWAKQAGGRRQTSLNSGAGVATDYAGGVCVTGIIRRAVVFGEGTDAVRLEADGFDAFLAKYVPRGPATALTGDWNGDGRNTAGWYRDGVFHLRGAAAGGADSTFRFGKAWDVPVVGDWDADGRDTIGVRRGTTWHLRNRNSSGSADISFSYRRAADQPVIGDWDSDGRDTVGVERAFRWLFRNRNDGGQAHVQFLFRPPRCTTVGWLFTAHTCTT